MTPPDLKSLLPSALGLGPDEKPFPWQEDLLERLKGGEVPPALDIPTGLGKTSVMAIWLLARASCPALPRRLVYVVDRRAVVDQATEVAIRLRGWVAENQQIRDQLGLREGRKLPISTLRGQWVDNREWLEDPAAPAIIVGTVDMIGSRLLFEGYGVSRKMRPYHAGLLGVDALVVLDEAHLVPPFERLLRSIETLRQRNGQGGYSLPPFRVMTLSATGRELPAGAIRLTDQDLRHPVVCKRLNARKGLRVDKLGEGQELSKKLAEWAWELCGNGQKRARVLVFSDSREVAQEARKEFDKLVKERKKNGGGLSIETELFVGNRRVFERDRARERLKELGFLAGSPAAKTPAVLFATSAAEVGVDLDSDHMVCDLVAWERMVQRLGRVNRRGESNSTEVIVIVAPPSEAERELLKRLEEINEKRELLGRLDGIRKRLEEIKEERELLEQLERVDGIRKRLAEIIKEERELLEQVDGIRKRLEKTEKQRKAIEAKANRGRQSDGQARRDWRKELGQLDKKRTLLESEQAKLELQLVEYRVRDNSLRVLQKLQPVGSSGNELLDASPAAILELRNRATSDVDLRKALEEATTPESLRPQLTQAVVDAWAMTSLQEHTGRPPIQPWLRGWVEDPPQTVVVWRKWLPKRSDGSAAKGREVEGFFEAAPPHVSEMLETETWQVAKWLRACAKLVRKEKESAQELATEESTNGGDAVALSVEPDGRPGEQLPGGGLGGGKAGQRLRGQLNDGDVVAFLMEPDGTFRRSLTLKELEDERAWQLKGAILVVDARLGGLDENGLLDEKAATVPRTADDGEPWLEEGAVGFRVREVGAAVSASPDRDWVERFRFPSNVSPEGEPIAWLVVERRRGSASGEEDDRAVGPPQPLDDHELCVEKRARLLAGAIGLPQEYEEALAVAARFHDEGKRARRWQRAFNAPTDKAYAKTQGPVDYSLLDGYRHELGSLLINQNNGKLQGLPHELQDLALHLVAAHHGFARPVIGLNGCEDAPPSKLKELARDVALRFAKLNARWGPWGLAWWEALLRAADRQASRENEERGRSAGGA